MHWLGRHNSKVAPAAPAPAKTPPRVKCMSMETAQLIHGLDMMSKDVQRMNDKVCPRILRAVGSGELLLFVAKKIPLRKKCTVATPFCAMSIFGATFVDRGNS